MLEELAFLVELDFSMDEFVVFFQFAEVVRRDGFFFTVDDYEVAGEDVRGIFLEP